MRAKRKKSVNGQGKKRRTTGQDENRMGTNRQQTARVMDKTQADGDEESVMAAKGCVTQQAD